MGVRVLKSALLVTSALSCLAAPAFGQVADLPQGGEVASGAASLNYSQPGALVVHQSTDSAIINWSSFDIGAANSVHFDQPGAESATLNRVLGDTPSVLAGALSAPGMVMLVNPNGVSITESGVVDTGSFVASTLDIADSDFLSGRTTFRRNGRAGVVSNRGAIRVSEGGSVALIGAGVINEGVVEARLGAVAFGAGDLVTLDFAGDGFLSIGIPVSDLEGLTDASGRPLSALITADGAVRADGGRIFLSAAGAQSLMRQAINVPGELIARSVGRDAQGRIVLEAHGGAAVLSGRLDASGGAHDGGDVVINGGAVVQGAVISADGAAGGSVQIAASGDMMLAGLISARGAAGQGGAVALSAGGALRENSSSATDVSGATDGGVIEVAGVSVLTSGRYSATGASGRGGRIDITGGSVSLLSAQLDARGATMGGLVRVGGGFQGGRDARTDSDLYEGFEGRFGAPGLGSADRVFVNDGVLIDVSATSGNGGAAIVWSNSLTTMLGAVNASGGFVEVSSADTLRTVDLSRLMAASVLLDPTNIVIGDFVAQQTWSYAAALDIDDAPVGVADEVGLSVAINAAGDRLAVGAMLDDGADNLSTDAGAVHLFTFSDNNFGGGAYVGTIGDSYVGAGNVNVTLDDADRFGSGLAMNAAGDRLAIGARADDGLGNVSGSSGAVYLYTFTDTSFGGAALAARAGVGYEIDLTANLSGGDLFGSALSLNADATLLAIGAPFDDGAPGTIDPDWGAVHLISFTNTSFGGGALAATIGQGYAGPNDINLGTGQSDNDQFGHSVTLNAAGDRLAAGAIRDDGPLDTLDQAGSVRLFTFTNTSGAGGVHVGTIGHDYAGANDVNMAGVLGMDDGLGIAVSFNALGDLLAIGATGDDGFGDSASNSGAVYLIQFDDGDFNGGQLVSTLGAGYAGAGNLSVPGVAAGDLFGRAVALNAAGDRLAVGVPGLTAAGGVTLFTASPNTLGNLAFGDSAADTVNISRAQLQATLSSGVNVVLQASNDITLNSGAGLAVNNTGGDGGDLTLQAGRSVVLNAAVSTDNGDLTIVANERASAGVVDAHRAAGDAVLQTASINAGTGAVRLTINDGAGLTNSSGGDMTLAALTAGAVILENLATSGGDIILNGVIAGSIGATPIVIAAGDGALINNVGAGVLDAGAGRWLIYAGAHADITANGLSANPFYNTLYNPAAPTTLGAAGNRFVFELAPTLTVTADDATRVYGDANPSVGYAITGLVGGDTLAGAVQGAAEITIDAALDADVGAYATLAALGTLASDYNYGFSFTPGVFTITQRAITVTADDLTRIYGDADPALTHQVTAGNLVFGDTLSGALARAGGENVGGYAITQGTLAASSNYTLTFVDGTLTITPRAITVTADDLTRIYGDADPALTHQITAGNMVFGDTLTGALTRTAGENVGAYAIMQGSLAASSNYTLTFVDGELTITPRAITVTADDLTRIYGDADPALTHQVTAGNLVFGDTLSGALTRAAGENIGGYAIGQGTLAAGGNYALTFVDGTLTITPRAITVTADDLSRIYGDADPALTHQITLGNMVFGDTLTGALTRAAGENVGDYAITQGALAASSNYTLTFVDGTLSITPRAITVTADDLTRIYGDADPALTHQVTAGNLVFGDTLSGALTRAAGENIGGYAIGQGTLAAGGNYALTFVDGTLTITPRAITVTADDLSRIYGDADPALTHQLTSGNLVFGDTLSGALTRNAGENVGGYAITQGTLAASSNYALTFVDGLLTITPRAITVTADDLSRIYGDADPALTHQVTAGNLVFGDTLSGALTRAAGENVGGYAIGQGTLSAGANYTLTFVDGTLTINARPITITADDLTRIYGDSDPALTHQITTGNLVFGDTLSGALTRAVGENVGGYAITQGTLSAGANYDVTFVDGTLTITPRAITVTADDLTRIYGDADPTLTHQITAGNLVFGDTLSGALTRAAGENVGGYAIQQGTLSAGGNYDVTFVDGTLTITPRAITITADDIGRVYGDADPALTYAISSGNLVFGDAVIGALERVAGEDVGVYAILQGTLSAGANYDVTFVDGAFTITPRGLVITADDLTRIYGDSDPALTYAITSGALEAGDSLTGALTRVAGENVGGYAITQGTLSAGANYTLTFVDGTLTITPRAITVTADDLSRIYGDADPAFTYAITSGNLVFSDTISGALTRAGGENIGDYAILQGTLTAGANYTLTYVDGSLTITPRAITVTADDVTRIYGDADPALTHQISEGNLVFGDTLAGALTRVAGENVGGYAIQEGTLSAGANYTLTFVDGAFTITPRAITVTADDLTRIYGDADPALTHQISAGNLVFGDTLSGALARTAGENVGGYAITQGALTAGANYDITFVNGTLTITPRAITVTADDLTRIYGDSDPALTHTVTGGNLVFGDALSGALIRAGGENVGVYTISQGTLSAGSNYTLTFVDGAFTITPRAITVTADDLARIYGDADPALTHAITSGNLVFGDTLSGALTRAGGENVGAYAILQGTLSAGSNYTLTFVQGALSITPRPLTLTGGSFTRVYGDADPALTYAITTGNLVFGDTLTGAATRAPGQNVGVYAVQQGTLSAGSNYAITFINGALTITPRAIVVTANDLSKIFGNADPALTWAVTGGNLVFGDTLGGALTRAPGQAVGDYAITQGSLGNANYAITFVNGVFTILPLASAPQFSVAESAEHTTPPGAQEPPLSTSAADTFFAPSAAPAGGGADECEQEVGGVCAAPGL